MEYFGKAGLNGQTAKLTTVKQVREIGSAVLTCEDLSNWATDTPVFFATYKVDIDTQKIVPNSQINWRGKVNVENNTIIEIQADSDTPDKGNAIGDIVECLPTAGWANSLVDGISVIHKQDGTLKNNVVKGQNIDFESIKDGSIEPGKIKGVPLKFVKINIQLKPFSEESFSSFNDVEKDQYVSVVKTNTYVSDARKYMWFVVNDNDWQMIQKIANTYADGLVIRTWRIDNTTSQVSLGLGTKRPNVQLIGMEIEK